MKGGEAVRNLFRAAFLALLIFEVSNLIRLLPLSPEFTWFGLILTLLVAWISLEAADMFLLAKYHKRMPWFIWPIVYALISYDALGDMFHLYGRWNWYDQIGHMAGTAVAMFVIVEIAKIATGRKTLSQSALLAAYGLAITIGTLYEIEEYLEDVFFMSNRLGDGPDTGNDLLMNLIGATLVFAYYYWQTKNKKKRR
jgi:hypothetical protein